jgi:hypothetical protein
MKRLFASALAIGLIAAAAAQTAQQSSSANALPPVQPPPDMDAPATNPATDPAKSTTPVIPLANSEAEAAAAAAAEAKATAERERALASPNFSAQQPDKKPLDSPGLPPDVQKAAEATELPVVTVRQNGNERVEEYRKRGVLYFVRVVPEEGPPRYYVDRVTNVPQDLSPIAGPSGVIQPVYFKLFEWK